MRAYSDLAWTEHIIAPPEDYKEETNAFIQAIKAHTKIKSRTLLHLGCGAGGNDNTFKKHFEVIGVDISNNMLDIARSLNPEATYHSGDMRTIRLKESFDVVAIPDSIGYMTTKEDLSLAIRTANRHLKPGGVLLITALIHEDFNDNNFVYTNSREDVEITLFENNFLPHASGTTYEATYVFLIRQKEKLEIHSETETIGLFDQATWHEVLRKEGFEIEQKKLEHLYDPYIVGEGKYPLTMYIGIKQV